MSKSLFVNKSVHTKMCNILNLSLHNIFPTENENMSDADHVAHVIYTIIPGDNEKSLVRGARNLHRSAL